jgi:hypothetical protein
MFFDIFTLLSIAKLRILQKLSNRVLSPVTSAETPQSLSPVYRKLASTHVGSWALTPGRLLASGRAGHDSVPRDDRPRGRKTYKIARQPACRQNDFVGERRYFAVCHKRTSFVKRTVVQCQSPQKTVTRAKPLCEVQIGKRRVLYSVVSAKSCAFSVILSIL